MRSEGKVQDESFILHSCVAHLLGADPDPGGDLETERQESPPPGCETEEDTDNNLFSHKRGGSQGLGGRTLGGEGTSFRGRKAALSLGPGQAPSSPDHERHLPPSWCSYHDRRPNTQDAVGVLRPHTARLAGPMLSPVSLATSRANPVQTLLMA